MHCEDAVSLVTFLFDLFYQRDLQKLSVHPLSSNWSFLFKKG